MYLLYLLPYITIYTDLCISASCNLHQQAAEDPTQQSSDLLKSPAVYTGACFPYIDSCLPDTLFSESLLLHSRILVAPRLLDKHDLLCNSYWESV